MAHGWYGNNIENTYWYDIKKGTVKITIPNRNLTYIQAILIRVFARMLAYSVRSKSS